MTKRRFLVVTDHLTHFPRWTMMEMTDSGQLCKEGSIIGDRAMLSEKAEANPDWFWEVKPGLFTAMAYELELPNLNGTPRMSDEQRYAVAYLATRVAGKVIADAMDDADKVGNGND